MRGTACHALHRARGFTLVELVVFIVIVAVVAIAMGQAFSGSSRGMASGKILTEVTLAAHQRMDTIVGQIRHLRSTSGFAGITATNYDPCPPVGSWSNQSCNAGTVNVSSSADFTPNVCGPGTAANCFEITVTAVDPLGAVSSPVTLKYRVSNY